MSEATADLMPATPARTRSIRGPKILFAMFGVIAVAIAVLVFAYTSREPDPKLPDLGTVPTFSLIDETGQTFTSDALRGHPTVINFVFTRCDTICPVIAMKTERLQEHTADRKGAGIKILTISVDPEYDRPDKLAEFGARYHADPTRWKFVTGPKDKITALVTGPLMNTMDREGNMPSGAPQIVHSGYFLLVDGDLTIRGVYDSNDIHKLDDLERHARFLFRTGGGDPRKFGGG